MSLSVSGATRVFAAGRRRTVALDSVDVEVAAGELVVVVGPSGSGKTTLLRAVAGLDPLDSGQVGIAGRDVTTLSPGRRDVAMVFQDVALLPHLSVRDNIGFGARARGTPAAERRRAVEDAAQTLDLEPLLERRPRELSGGERQRVALARALLRRPAAFLLDEPFTGLDPDLRLRARTEVRMLQRRLGVSMLYVTHDQQEAAALADRIIVLRSGQVEQVGTAAELYDRPVNPFVARFASPWPMNLLSGTKQIVGVRPERMTLEPVTTGSTPDPPDVGLVGCVVLVEAAGEHAYVHVGHDQSPTSPVPVLVRTRWPERPREGDRVLVRWSPADQHLFPDDGAGPRP